MYNYNKPIGNYGENLSKNFLVSKGHKILKKNFRCNIGEIDIISMFNDYIHFTEVKTRYSTKYGLPCEAITHKKINTIKNTAIFYITKNNIWNYNFTFNVIEILIDAKKHTHTLNFIENAF